MGPRKAGRLFGERTSGGMSLKLPYRKLIVNVDSKDEGELNMLPAR